MCDSRFYFMRFVGFFQVLFFKYLYFSWYKVVRRGGTGMRQRRAAGFSISVFGRFAYTLSALDGHYLEMFWEFFGFLVMFVQSRQDMREQPDT